MRPLETALHGVSLAACVALGAGVWSLSQREAPAPPPPAVTEANLQSVSREVAELRREIGDLRRALDERPQESSAPRTASVSPASARAPESAPSAALVAALEDPKVQERIQAVVDARLEEEQKDRETRMRDRGREFVQERVKAFEEKAGLNDPQKELFGKLMAEASTHLDAVRGQVRDRKLTRDQARDDLKRWYAEMDVRVQATMTADQFKQYQEWSQPMRDLSMRNGWGGLGGNDRGRRSSRENPVP